MKGETGEKKSEEDEQTLKGYQWLSAFLSKGTY